MDICKSKNRLPTSEGSSISSLTENGPIPAELLMDINDDGEGTTKAHRPSEGSDVFHSSVNAAKEGVAESGPVPAETLMCLEEMEDSPENSRPALVCVAPSQPINDTINVQSSLADNAGGEDGIRTNESLLAYTLRVSGILEVAEASGTFSLYSGGNDDQVIYPIGSPSVVGTSPVNGCVDSSLPIYISQLATSKGSGCLAVACASPGSQSDNNITGNGLCKSVGEKFSLETMSIKALQEAHSECVKKLEETIDWLEPKLYQELTKLISEVKNETYFSESVDKDRCESAPPVLNGNAQKQKTNGKVDSEESVAKNSIAPLDLVVSRSLMSSDRTPEEGGIKKRYSRKQAMRMRLLEEAVMWIFKEHVHADDPMWLERKGEDEEESGKTAEWNNEDEANSCDVNVTRKKDEEITEQAAGREYIACMEEDENLRNIEKQLKNEVVETEIVRSAETEKRFCFCEKCKNSEPTEEMRPNMTQEIKKMRLLKDEIEKADPEMMRRKILAEKKSRKLEAQKRVKEARERFMQSFGSTRQSKSAKCTSISLKEDEQKTKRPRRNSPESTEESKKIVKKKKRRKMIQNSQDPSSLIDLSNSGEVAASECGMQSC